MSSIESPRRREGAPNLTAGLARLARALGALGCAAALAACGPSGGGASTAGAAAGSGMSGLLSFGTPTPAYPALDPNAPKLRSCPEVMILDGGAALRVGGGTNESVRHQFSITDTARECQIQGQTLSIKVGVAGDLLLGPAGSSGTYSAGVKVSLRSEKDQKIIATRSYRITATVSGATPAPFSVVAEPFTAPFLSEYSADDYSILVSLTGGGERKAARRKRR